MQLKKIYKKYKNYSIPSKVTIISLIVALLAILIFNIYPISNNFIQMKRTEIKEEKNKKEYIKNMLKLTYNKQPKYEVSFNNPDSEYISSTFFWYSLYELYQNDLMAGVGKINKILEANSQIVSSDVMNRYLLNGLINALYQGDFNKLKKFIDLYPESKKLVNLQELDLIYDIYESAESCKNVLLDNEITFHTDPFLRRLQFNFWHCVLILHEDVFIAATVQSILSHLYPEVISQSIYTEYSGFGNIRLMNAYKRKFMHHIFEDVFTEFKKYEDRKNYNRLLSLVINFSRNGGFVSKQNVNEVVHRFLKDNISDDEILITYNYIKNSNSIFLVIFKGKQFPESNETMHYFFEESTMLIYKINYDNTFEILDEDNRIFISNFIEILPFKDSGLFITETDGTYEGKTIQYININNNEYIKKYINNSNDIPDYHSKLFYSNIDNNEVRFSWFTETHNGTQANASRKVSREVEFSFNPSLNTITHNIKFGRSPIKYIEDLYNSQLKTQLKIMDAVTIDKKVIKDKGFIKIMKKPSDYYLNSLVDSTLLIYPSHLLPKQTVLFFELREKNFNKSLEKNYVENTGYAVLLNYRDDDYIIENIYHFDDIKLKKIY